MSEIPSDLARRPEILISVLVAFWFVLMFLIARLTGWAALAEHYRAPERFTGTCWRFQSIQTRWLTHYGNCVTVGANADGLSVSVFFPLRIGHSPLFIPWHHITVSKKKCFFGNVVELRCEKAPSAPMYISQRLAKRIALAPGSAGRGTLQARNPIA